MKSCRYARSSFCAPAVTVIVSGTFGVIPTSGTFWTQPPSGAAG